MILRLRFQTSKKSVVLCVTQHLDPAQNELSFDLRTFDFIFRHLFQFWALTTKNKYDSSGTVAKL
jgi:hypothetical protein